MKGIKGREGKRREEGNARGEMGHNRRGKRRDGALY